MTEQQSQTPPPLKVILASKSPRRRDLLKEAGIKFTVRTPIEPVDETLDADELMMTALDAGAEDFKEEEDSYEILTSPEEFSAVRQTLEEAGIPMAAAEVTMIPQTYVELTDEKDIAGIQKTLDMLDDDDDVQNVYHNWDE